MVAFDQHLILGPNTALHWSVDLYSVISQSFYIHIQDFFELTIWLRYKLSTFLSNTNFLYYRSPIHNFYGAIFNQPLCVNLQSHYFKFRTVKYFLLRQYKAFCETSRLRAQTALKLCLIFLRHCDVSFILSQLRYQCFCHSSTFLMTLK